MTIGTQLLLFGTFLFIFIMLKPLLNYKGWIDKAWKHFLWPICDVKKSKTPNRKNYYMTDPEAKFTKIGGKYKHVYSFTPEQYIIIWLEDGDLHVNFSDKCSWEMNPKMNMVRRNP